jgi:hypothetical protein
MDGVPMREEFTFGNVESDAFFAFYGDSNGDRTVNVIDLLAFRQAYNSVDGDGNYNYAMDFQANGLINVLDLLPFRTRFGITIPFTFGSNRSSLFSGGKSSAGQSGTGKLVRTR